MTDRTSNWSRTCHLLSLGVTIMVSQTALYQLRALKLQIEGKAGRARNKTRQSLYQRAALKLHEAFWLLKTARRT